MMRKGLFVMGSVFIIFFTTMINLLPKSSSSGSHSSPRSGFTIGGYHK